MMYINIQVGVGSAPFTFPMEIDLESKPSEIIPRALKFAGENALAQLEENSARRKWDTNNKFRAKLSTGSDPLDNYSSLRVNNVKGYLPKAGEIAKNATFSKASTVEIYNQDDLTWNPTQNEVTVETVTG